MITARLAGGPLGGRALDVPDDWVGDWPRLATARDRGRSTA
uniref:Uncharacterized protein n=1 Tax=Streptomyces sp. NBC_00148 TaxID=2903626 RepID=A0AAU1M5X7_9ACTN